MYALVQVFDGFSIGLPAGFGAAIVRGPWLAARALPFAFLLTLNRRGDQPLALATGLAAGQLFCSAYIDELTRTILKGPDRFAGLEAVLSCLAPLLVALILWRRQGSFIGHPKSFALRALFGAGVIVALSVGPLATMLATATILSPAGLRWR